MWTGDHTTPHNSLTTMSDFFTSLNNTQPTQDVLVKLQELTSNNLGDHFQQRHGFYHIQMIDSGDFSVYQLVCEDNIENEFNEFILYKNGQLV